VVLEAIIHLFKVTLVRILFLTQLLHLVVATVSLVVKHLVEVTVEVAAVQDRQLVDNLAVLEHPDKEIMVLPVLQRVVVVAAVLLLRVLDKLVAQEQHHHFQVHQ
jgi:hypothetical protein